jgi:hypothetical protein
MKEEMDAMGKEMKGKCDPPKGVLMHLLKKWKALRLPLNPPNS